MDALSGVASGMAVASLSLQLIQSISTINTFIRAVKGAPKELERLVESLERLRAILNDICQLMELQTSRSSHGIPMPSMTIFNCLKSCEHQLRPLQSLVDRYGNNHSQDRSKSGKLWDSVTMGFKTKDILGFEARIQQEMTNLTTALIMNSTSIQLHTLPRTYISQHLTSTSPVPHLYTNSAITDMDHSLSPNMGELGISNTSALTFTRLCVHSVTSLERAGLRRSRTLLVLRTKNTEPGAGKQLDHSDVVREESIYSWDITRLGFGIRLTRIHPYGSILPALTTYPIIDWTLQHSQLFESGSISDIQQAFHSGTMHPFAQNCKGYTLLHYAARFRRVELCRLLIGIGVKLEYNHYGYSPLVDVVSCALNEGSQAIIDTFRYFIGNTQAAEDHYWATAYDLAEALPLDFIEWLWATGPSYISDDGIPSLKRFCIRYALRWLHDPLERKPAIDFLNRTMTPEVIYEIVLDWLDWLEVFFYWDGLQFESFEAGKAFLDVLLHAKVDLEMLIQRSLQADSLLDGWPEWYGLHSRSRRVYLENTKELGWTLEWRWEHNAREPGFMVASEFYTLGEEERFQGADPWPYTPRIHLAWADKEKDHVKMRRFNRGMAAKARKEMKRSGQRRVRSSMPGSWID